MIHGIVMRYMSRQTRLELYEYHRHVVTSNKNSKRAHDETLNYSISQKCHKPSRTHCSNDRSKILHFATSMRINNSSYKKFPYSEKKKKQRARENSRCWRKTEYLLDLRDRIYSLTIVENSVDFREISCIMSGEQFSLVWNSFPTNLSSGLYTLFTDEHLVDVTLTAEGRILRAHKLILSVCSSYFRELFEGNTCKHPIVILKDVNYRDLSAMLHFMYQGEVNIRQEDISSFLKLAETLQIKGLTKEKRDDDFPLNEANEERNNDFLKTEISCDDALGRNGEETISRRLNETVCSPRRRVSPDIMSDKSFVKVKSDNAFQQSETDSDTENVMRSISSIFNENNYDNESNKLPIIEDEPLDYTSDVRLTTVNNEEPLNYRINVNMNNHPSQDFVPNLQLLSYDQNCGKETLGVENQPRDSKDLHYNGTSYSRGKRTVRGLPGGGTLPLETTLRVVSEIGPTLRVDRGKVVRMYSCPWCLRHFTRKENLKLHVRYIHGPLESLTCKLCGNKYKNSNSLRVHSYLYHNTRRSKHTKPQMLGGNV